MKRFFTKTILLVLCFLPLLMFGQIEVNPCTGIDMQTALNQVVTNNTQNQTILVDAYYFTNEGAGGNWDLSTINGGSSNIDGLTIDFQGAYIQSSAAGLGIFDISGIDNMTIQNATFHGFNRSTGAINVDGCIGTVFENIKFVNSPTTRPMAISSDAGNTSATFNNCEFSGNPGTSESPSETPNSGGVQLSGHQTNTLNVTFNNTTFRCNATLDPGGAVFAQGDGGAANRTITTVSFNDCNFENNTANGASGGGAVYAATTMTLNVTNCNFSNNEATGSNSFGGALSINAGVELNVSGCYFYDNTNSGGSADGGAIGTNGGSSNRNNVVITNSVFLLNTCVDEGGVCFFRHCDNVTMTGSLMVNNNSPDGGAFHIENAGTFSIDNSTITGTTGTGRGVENNSGTLTINNSIIASNSIVGSFSGSNNTTSGTPAFTNPAAGNYPTDPTGHNYDVAGTQGATIGVLADVSASADCNATAVAPPAGATPCQPLNGAGPVAVSGSLFDDADGYTDSTVDGTATDGTAAGPLGQQMYVNLVKDGAVVASVAVAADGTYSFPTIDANTSGFTVVLTTSATSTTPALPTGWEFTGENLGTNNQVGTGSESTTLGQIALGTGTNAVSGLLFGINKLPVINSMTSPGNANPGGTDNVDVAALNVFSAEDLESTISSITITQFPTGATSFQVSGVTYYPTPGDIPATCPTATCSAFPGSGGLSVPTNTLGNPNSLTVDPSFDSPGSVVFTYTTTDEAGAVSPAGTATIDFPNAAPVLPVELTYFNAKSQNCEVKLSWQTATEINNAYFEIQRSRDGQTFETIEKMTGAGSSETIQRYEFMDEKPMVNNYYRLKQVDFDGQFDYSNIEIAKTDNCHGTGTINVYPNPVNDKLTVELTAEQAANVQVVIYDYSGKEIVNRSTNLDSGINVMPINTTNFQAGIYFVQVMNNGQISELIKFVKK